MGRSDREPSDLSKFAVGPSPQPIAVAPPTCASENVEMNDKPADGQWSDSGAGQNQVRADRDEALRHGDGVVLGFGVKSA